MINLSVIFYVYVYIIFNVIHIEMYTPYIIIHLFAI